MPAGAQRKGGGKGKRKRMGKQGGGGGNRGGGGAAARRPMTVPRRKRTDDQPQKQDLNPPSYEVAHSDTYTSGIDDGTLNDPLGGKLAREVPLSVDSAPDPLYRGNTNHD